MAAKKTLIADSGKYDDSSINESKRLEYKLSKEIPFDSYFKWYHDSYTSQLPETKLKTKYTDGMLKRISNVSTMKYAIHQNMLYVIQLYLNCTIL